MKFANNGPVKRDNSMQLLKPKPDPDPSTVQTQISVKVDLPKVSTSYRYVRTPVHQDHKKLQDSLKRLLKLGYVNTTIAGRAFHDMKTFKKSKGRPIGVVLALIDHNAHSIALGWSLCNESSNDVFDKAHGRHLALGVAQGHLVSDTQFWTVPTVHTTEQGIVEMGYPELRKMFLALSKIDAIPNSIVSTVSHEALYLLTKYPHYTIHLALLPEKKKRVRPVPPSSKERASLRMKKLQAKLAPQAI